MLAEGFLGEQSALDLMLMRFIYSLPLKLLKKDILFYESYTNTWLTDHRLL
jgi:hypothetical protein